MIPSVDILSIPIEEKKYHDKTYRISIDKSCISGYVTDFDAVVQAIHLILSTERYKYNIYSWDYGVELVDLIGKPITYVMVELPRRIKDALIQDNRIIDVIDFKFDKKGRVLHTSFKVVSKVGNIPTTLEVNV